MGMVNWSALSFGLLSVGLELSTGTCVLVRGRSTMAVASVGAVSHHEPEDNISVLCQSSYAAPSPSVAQSGIAEGESLADAVGAVTGP